MAKAHIDIARRAFGEQHRNDCARRAVAEQLTERLLVIGNAMAFDQRDEVVLGIAIERGFMKVRIGGQKSFRLAMQVGEIAPPAAGDQDFGARLVEMIQQQHLAAALSRGQSAHQPGGAGTDHDGVERLARAHVPLAAGPSFRLIRTSPSCATLATSTPSRR